MPYLPEAVPAPHVDDVNEPFWDHCNHRRLAFQQCGNCGALVHPPLPVCPRCQSLDRRWRQAPGEAIVFSFTWAHTAAHGSVRESLPYNIVLVEFPGLPGVRLISNVMNVAPGELAIGDPLYLAWDENGGAGQVLPRFRKREGNAAGSVQAQDGA